jgi:release factor glutamine methyltransferase
MHPVTPTPVDSTPITVKQALVSATALGLDRLDSQLLLLQAMGKTDTDRAWLLTHDDDQLAAATSGLFKQLCERRAAGEPWAYIAGFKEFFGLLLKVDARVLVPRPDTETLAQWAIDLLPGQQADEVSVLDLGTGSGAIALAIAHHCQQTSFNARIVAIDASFDALALASENAGRLGLAGAIRFYQGNWLEGLEGQFALIVSNPPYIASADPHLKALAHEPLQALASGADGLDDIRRIISAAPAHLLHGGWLLLEHGYDQAAQVGELLASWGFQRIQSRVDLAGHTRCSGGQWLPG